jgi:hypothetical protein
MDEPTQQRLEGLLEGAIGIGLTRLVAERFITDLVPEQRGLKDDVLRAPKSSNGSHWCCFGFGNHQVGSSTKALGKGPESHDKAPAPVVHSLAFSPAS